MTTLSTQITKNSKTLSLLVVALQENALPTELKSIVSAAFNEVAPFIHDGTQVLYIRDIPFLTIDGEYPAGHCYNRHEAMIAVPSWNNLSMRQLTSTIYHELHHMARWQNVGYGTTLGGAILSEGIATYYEILKSGVLPPYVKTEVTEQMLAAAKSEWSSKDYDHGQWFFESEWGRWAGYAIGYKLAKSFYDTDGFNLEHSVNVAAESVEVKL